MKKLIKMTGYDLLMVSQLRYIVDAVLFESYRDFYVQGSLIIHILRNQLRGFQNEYG